jgi:hypothetical protein
LRVTTGYYKVEARHHLSLSIFSVLLKSVSPLLEALQIELFKSSVIFNVRCDTTAFFSTMVKSSVFQQQVMLQMLQKLSFLRHLH